MTVLFMDSFHNQDSQNSLSSRYSTTTINYEICSDLRNLKGQASTW